MKKYFLHLTIVLTVVTLAFTYTNSFIVRGKVIDEKGSPVTGASIVVKDTKIATTSGHKGEFSIKVPGKESKLIISYVGYDNTEVAVKFDTDLIIKLRATYQGLQKVAVTGNGQQLKGKVAGLAVKGLSGNTYAAPKM
ncbi:MAG: carboxypeptidase-like regulatory domain-containing protein [Segetibacter sp.]